MTVAGERAPDEQTPRFKRAPLPETPMPPTGHALADLGHIANAWVEWGKSHDRLFPRLRWRIPGPGPQRRWRKKSRYLGASYREDLLRIKAKGDRITPKDLLRIKEQSP